MQFDKLTVKSQEALQEAKAIAERNNHQQIDVEHLLLALLNQKEGIVIPILQKLGANPDGIASAAGRRTETDSQGDRRRSRTGLSLQPAERDS